MKRLEKIAIQNVSRPTIEVLLRKWWEQKFHSPITSADFVSQYPEDLYVMFAEDMIRESEEYEASLREEHLGLDAPETGDALVDLWNRQLARGEMPDLGIGEPENAARRDRLIREKARRHYAETGELIYVPPLQTAHRTQASQAQERIDFASEVDDVHSESLVSRTQRDDLDDFAREADFDQSERFESKDVSGVNRERENVVTSRSETAARRSPREKITGSAFDAWMNAAKDKS